MYNAAGLEQGKVELNELQDAVKTPLRAGLNNKTEVTGIIMTMITV